MAQSYIQQATDGTGKKVDTVTTATAAQHRQVMVVGDASVDANVGKVDSTGSQQVAIYDAAAPTTANLTAADIASTTTSTGFNGAIVTTGTPTTNSSLSISFNGENAVAIQLTGTWFGTVTFERSMDGTNWHPATVLNSGNPYTSVTGNGTFYINAAGATQARARVTAFTSGTVVTALYAATGVFPISVLNAQLGQYNSSLPTITSGNSNAIQIDANGRQITTLGSLLAGEDITNDVMKVENRYNATVISTAATTVIKIGAGLLQRIIVTGGTTGTIIIYDNAAASGTKLADFDTTNTLAQYEFNVAFSTGLTVVTSAATKITAVWR